MDMQVLKTSLGSAAILTLSLPAAFLLGQGNKKTNKQTKNLKPTDLWHQLKKSVQLTNKCDCISPCHISNSLLVKQAGQPLLSHSKVTIL